jgi:hypothetical protein
MLNEENISMCIPMRLYDMPKTRIAGIEIWAIKTFLDEAINYWQLTTIMVENLHNDLRESWNHKDRNWHNGQQFPQ